MQNLYILKRSIYVLLLILSMQTTLYAQIEANNWYFGKNTGIDFSTGYPEILFDGNMTAPAGCSSISDKNGNLLFYTNGQTVWNKDHQIMTGGNGLSGEIESIQSCIIIPKPNDESVYYIFKTRQTLNNVLFVSPGIYYTEINFTAANPLGIVVNENRKISESRTNQITAIHTPDGESIRVIAYGSTYNADDSPKDTFFFINVTSAGVQLPIIQKTNDRNIPSTGAIKISPDGKKIAIADQGERYVYLYDFNNETLDITFDMDINCDQFFGIVIKPYGLEFSQNSKILYISAHGDASSYLYQFDLLGNGEFFEKYIVAASSALNPFGSLQMARDGKLYVSYYKDRTPPGPNSFLGVINRPDKPGIDCDFVRDEPDLNGSSSRGSLKGLPNYIASIFRNRIITNDRCVDEAFDFDLDAYSNITGVVWDFGDGATSTSFTPTHQYAVGKDYLVKATITLKNNPITLFKHISAYPLPSLVPNQTMKQCDLDSDGISIFNLNNVKDLVSNHETGFEYTFYKTQQDAIDGTNAIENPEVYQNTVNPQEIFINIVSRHGCASTSSFFIEASYIELSPIAPLYSCENSDVPENHEGTFDLVAKEAEIRTQFSIPPTAKLSFYLTSQDALTITNPLGPNPALPSGTVWVRADNQDFSCNGVGSFTITVNPAVNLDSIEARYKLCNEGSPLVLDGGASNDRWEWKNNSGTILSTQRTFPIVELGRYTITAYKTLNGITCEMTKAFFVVDIIAPTFKVVKAENEQIYVSINGESTYEFSIDGTHFFGEGKEFTFREIPGGVYTVYVRDVEKCGGLLTQKVALIGYPKYFSPNADGLNEQWKLQGVNKQLYAEATVYIYDRYGNFLFFMNLDGNQSGWDGKLNGKSLPASDYWYTSIVIDLDDNVYTKKGHFSLIR